MAATRIRRGSSASTPGHRGRGRRPGLILEKFHSWSDRCESGRSLPFELDELLTNLSIYWFTETITSSTRIYREGANDPLALSADDPLTVPTAVADFPFEIDVTQPLERMVAVTDLRRWTRFPRGGHFAAMEEPLLLAQDIATFLKELVEDERQRDGQEQKSRRPDGSRPLRADYEARCGRVIPPGERPDPRGSRPG